MPHHQETQALLPIGHQSGDLETLFEYCFFDTCNTRLCGGGDEPVYLPAEQEGDSHRLIYREDFFASALHEISHWCIAGTQRRNLVDFGYWYTPDGRDAEQQCAFEQVEVKPQALEWVFSEAAGVVFQVSTDNLSGLALSGSTEYAGGEHSALSPFRTRVWRQVREYCERGLPERAGQFVQALSEAYSTGDVLDISRYHLDHTAPR